MLKTATLTKMKMEKKKNEYARIIVGSHPSFMGIASVTINQSINILNHKKRKEKKAYLSLNLTLQKNK